MHFSPPPVCLKNTQLAGTYAKGLASAGAGAAYGSDVVGRENQFCSNSSSSFNFNFDFGFSFNFNFDFDFNFNFNFNLDFYFDFSFDFNLNSNLNLNSSFNFNFNFNLNFVRSPACLFCLLAVGLFGQPARRQARARRRDEWAGPAPVGRCLVCGLALRFQVARRGLFVVAGGS